MRLGFLGGLWFCLENEGQAYWILLDFLGFSRPNRDFFNGLRGIFAKKIFRALVPPNESRPSEDAAFAVMRIRRIVHAESLPIILISVK
jgi:hypothetical protein